MQQRGLSTYQLVGPSTAFSARVIRTAIFLECVTSWLGQLSASLHASAFSGADLAN